MQGLDQQADRYVARGRAFALTAVVIFGVTFAVMWGPFYFFGSQGQLFLYPIALLMILFIAGFAIVGLTFAVLAASKAPPKSRVMRAAIAWIFISAALVVLPLPVVWFGSLPALLFA